MANGAAGDIVGTQLQLLGLGAYTSGYFQIARSIDRASHSLDNFTAKRVALTAAGFVAAQGAFRFIKSSVTEFGKMEQRTAAFHNMLGGSRAETSKFISELEKFADVSLFTFNQTADLTQQIMAMGFSAKEVVPLMKTLGDVAAGVGGDPEKLNRIVLAIGQIKTRGKVVQQELNQLSQAGVNVNQVLEELGITAVQKGNIGREGIPAERFLEAFTTVMNKRFGGQMEAQLDTILGQVNQITDRWEKFLRNAGAPFAGPVKEGLKAISEALNAISTSGAAPIVGAGIGAAGLLGAGMVIRTGLGVFKSLRVAGKDKGGISGVLGRTISGALTAGEEGGVLGGGGAGAATSSLVNLARAANMAAGRLALLGGAGGLGGGAGGGAGGVSGAAGRAARGAGRSVAVRGAATAAKQAAATAATTAAASTAAAAAAGSGTVISALRTRLGLPGAAASQLPNRLRTSAEIASARFRLSDPAGLRMKLGDPLLGTGPLGFSRTIGNVGGSGVVPRSLRGGGMFTRFRGMTGGAMQGLGGRIQGWAGTAGRFAAPFAAYAAGDFIGGLAPENEGIGVRIGRGAGKYATYGAGVGAMLGGLKGAGIGALLGGIGGGIHGGMTNPAAERRAEERWNAMLAALDKIATNTDPERQMSANFAKSVGQNEVLMPLPGMIVSAIGNGQI